MARRWVLLVHEDPAALTELENALQGTGLHVTMARNAVLGAAQAHDLRPALVISDQEFAADAPFIHVGKTIDQDAVKARAVELTTAHPAAEAQRAETPAAARRAGRRWVLFIHDDAAMVSDVEQALHGTGMHLTTAADVALAAVQIRDMRPVLIVSDIATAVTDTHRVSYDAAVNCNWALQPNDRGWIRKRAFSSPRATSWTGNSRSNA